MSDQNEEVPEPHIPRGERLFQINKSDLEDLERIVPELADMAQFTKLGRQPPALRTKINRVKQILSNVRWNYGPYEETDQVPAGE